MSKVNLLLAVHCHQPVGNFDRVFKEAYDKAYLPFIKVLEKHPRIRIALHYSGCLLDWLEEKSPEFLGILKRLVKNGQAEIMGGGYYEPLLPLIPEGDRLGQIEMLSNFIKRRIGYQPKGAWLAERVWEPYLAKTFNQAGLGYTIVDDSHFELAGKRVEEIPGYYLTEEEGFTLAIFPSSKKLRYAMPFKLPQDTIDYLRSAATPGGERAVTFGDDGEKFGLWPKTYRWVYEEGWLENFFKALEENSDWINILLPSEYLNRYEPLGRVYLPCASYPEMLEWSGGYFRNFLVKYPEANWLHKRMLYVSENLRRVKGKASSIKKARESLYKAQCNCAYWHGVFGGLYLHHLRNSVYTNLIDAEKLIGGQTKTGNRLKAEALDIDKDGSEELVMENGPLSIFVRPREGGAITEIDYRPKSLNLVNTLARRPEPYHKKIGVSQNPGHASSSQTAGIASIHDLIETKEKRLDELLAYDWHQKYFLVEHFLSPEADAVSFSKAAFQELGDFVVSPYKYDLRKEASKITAGLEREGIVKCKDLTPSAIKVDKAVAIESGKATLKMSYRIKNMTDRDLNLWFGAEFNLSLKDPEFYKVGELMDIKQLKIEDEWFGIFLDYLVTKNADLWFYPIETVSESEAGLERTYQGLCFLFHWRLDLKAKQTWSTDISLDIRQAAG